jgi:hypothetical protein
MGSHIKRTIVTINGKAKSAVRLGRKATDLKRDSRVAKSFRMTMMIMIRVK